MTLKAVDLQVILPKIQDVGRIQQVQQSNEQAQQHSFAAQLLREKKLPKDLFKTRLRAKREGSGRRRKSPVQKEFWAKGCAKRSASSEQNQEMPTVAPGHLIDLKI